MGLFQQRPLLHFWEFHAGDKFLAGDECLEIGDHDLGSILIDIYVYRCKYADDYVRSGHLGANQDIVQLYLRSLICCTHLLHFSLWTPVDRGDRMNFLLRQFDLLQV
jgi:hypothetical protein